MIMTFYNNVLLYLEWSTFDKENLWKYKLMTE